MNLVEMTEILGAGILTPCENSVEEKTELQSALARVNEEMQDFSKQNNFNKMEAYVSSTESYLV